MNAFQLKIYFLSSTSRWHKFYFQNWSGTSANFQNANSASTGVVFTNNSAIISANLKGTQLSDNVYTYANNSQRKFIRTPDGYLHNVYESMNRVWYEISTDNGTTWELMNSGKPLSSFDSKLPSIDYYGNVVAIVWQEKNVNNYKIQLATFYRYSNYYKYGITATVFNEPNESYSTNTNPVIGWGYNGKAMIIWEGKYLDPFNQSIR